MGAAGIYQTDHFFYGTKKLPIFEQLEPRILLSADLIPIPVDADTSTEMVSLEETSTANDASQSEPLITQVGSSDDSSIKPSDTSPQGQSDNSNTIAEADDSALQSTPDTETPNDDAGNREIVFINSDIDGFEELVSDLKQKEDTDIFILDSHEDGIAQINTALGDRENISALHFFTHSNDSAVKMGSSWLNTTTLNENQDSIAAWGDSLTDDGDILLYGCDLASNQSGVDLVTQISNLTGADVAASDNPTGHELMGGDWVLEYQLGDIEADLPLNTELQGDWVHVLAEETIADNFNSDLYNNSTGTVGWANDWTEFGDTTDPDSGYIYLVDDRLCIETADYDEVQRGITRTVNLSGAAAANISFDFEMDPNENSGNVTLQIQSQGDPIWHDIVYFWTSYPYTDTASFDITSYISASTKIRFESSTGFSGLSFGSDNFYVDNLTIDYTTDTWTAPLWITTGGDVKNGGQQGTETWNDSDIIRIANPDLSLGNTTSGDFSTAALLSSFAHKDTDIDALHYVSRDIQIGSSNFQLQKGDVLFVAHGAEPGDFGLSDIDREDIVLYRPTTQGDYTSGTFQILFDDLTGTDGSDIRGITLIEKDVTVGGKDLNAGDLLFVQSGGNDDKIVWLYETGDVEPATGTSGDISVLLDCRDDGVKVNENFRGIDLVEETITVGGKTLNSGTILLSVDKADTIGTGDDSLDVQQFDIFALDVTSLSEPTGSGVATASLFFDGSDVAFNDDNEEKLDGFTLTLGPEQSSNTITYGTFDAQNNTITLTGTDFTFTGSIGSDVKSNMDWSKFVWDINSDDGTTPDITFSFTDFSEVIVTSDTTLTLNLTGAKSNAIVAATGYGATGGVDTLDITAGFSGNGSGDYSTTDGLSDGPLTTITTPTDIALSFSSVDENIDSTGGLIIGTLSAADADFGDSATFTIDGGTDAGLFNLGGDGNNQLILKDGMLDHERKDSYQVTIRVTDSGGLFTVKALTITVNNINEAPVIDNNSLTLIEGQTTVLSNSDLSATDPESTNSSLSFSVSSISGGQFEYVSTPDAAITSFLQSDINTGNVHFVHNGTDTIPTYDVTVTDGSLTTGPATAAINYTPTNDSPVFSNNQLTINEGDTVVLDSSDLQVVDPDNNDTNLTFTATNVVGGQFELVASSGTAILSFTQEQVNNGEVQFVHNGGEITPGYEIAVNDTTDTTGPSAATIAYTPANDAPKLQNYSLNLFQGENVLLNSTHFLALDPDDNPADLTYTVTYVNTAGQFELDSNPGSAITGFTQLMVNNGEVRFVHDTNEPAPSFLVEVSDDDGLKDGPVLANINFNTVNQAPVLQNNTLTIDEDSTVILSAANIMATDSDNNDASLIFTVSGVTSGQFELLSNPSVTITEFNQADVTAGDVRFIHDGGEIAPAYDVTVSDGSLSHGPSAAIITFNNVNDAPVLGNNVLTIDEGGTVRLDSSNLSATDVESVDGTLTFTVSDVTGGMFTTVTAATLPIFSFTQDQVTASEIQFIHNGGEAVPTYKVTLSDSEDSDGPENANIVFIVENDAPILDNNSLSINEGGTVVLTITNLSATDIDNVDGNLTISVTNVTGGHFEKISATGTPITTFLQSEVIGGEIQFVHDGNETAPTYTLKVSDGDLATSPADAIITFTGENDAAVLGNNSLTISEGGAVILTAANFSATDTDNGDPSLVFIVTDITGGHFELLSDPDVAITSFVQAQITGGLVQFVHDGNEEAPEFSTMVFDGSEMSSQQTATISFTPVNDAPTATNLSLTDSYNEDAAKTLAPIVINDVDSGSLYTATFTLSDTTAGSFNTGTLGTASATFSAGVLTISGADIDDVNGLLSSVVFTPESNYNSNFTIATSVSDGASPPVTGSRSMNTIAVNDAPLATNLNQSGTYVEDTVYDLQDIVVSDVDADEIITAQMTLASADHGTLSTAGGATFDAASGIWSVTGDITSVNSALANVTFTPKSDSFIDTSIAVEIEDGNEDGVTSLSGLINLTGTAVADAPVVSNAETLTSTPTDPIYITTNSADGAEITHFQITEITKGELYLLDGLTPVAENDFITVDEGAAGLIFTPSSENQGTFTVKGSQDGTTISPISSSATSTITVNETQIPAPVITEETNSNGATTDTGGENTETPAEPTALDETLELAAGQDTGTGEPHGNNSDGPSTKEGDTESGEQKSESENTGEENIDTALTYVNARKISTSETDIGLPIAATLENLSFDLSFAQTRVSSFSFSSSTSQIVNSESASLDDASGGEYSFSTTDYNLLDLQYRERSFEEYQAVRQSLDSFREQTEQEASIERTVVGSAIAASTGLSAGYVIWLLRSGALLSSILSSLPAWQLADPLAVLAGAKNEEDEDDSIESIIEKGTNLPTVDEQTSRPQKDSIAD